MNHVAAPSPTFNVLSLCSGIGGLDLGVKIACPNARAVCYVEKEAYCAAILAQKAKDDWLDDAPIWSDVKSFNGKPWRGSVDCVIGGYPCQPHSYTGKRKGKKDPRDLWPDFARIVNEVKPSWCFFENVPGHFTSGFQDVVRDLETMGFTVAAGVFSAAEIGASIERERLFIMARADRCPEIASLAAKHHQAHERGVFNHASGLRNDVEASVLEQPACEREGGERTRSPSWQPERAAGMPRGYLFPPMFGDDLGWGEIVRHESQPIFPGVAHGHPNRLDRLSAVGNAVCPLAAAHAFTTLMGAISQRT